MKPMIVGLAVLTVLGISLGVWHALTSSGFQTSLRAGWEAAPANLWLAFVQEILLNPWFYAVLALVCLLERLIPADPQQKPLSKGILQDVVWVPFTLFAHAFVLPLHILFLRCLYQRYLGFLTLQSVAGWPWLARVLLAVLVSD